MKTKDETTLDEGEDAIEYADQDVTGDESRGWSLLSIAKSLLVIARKLDELTEAYERRNP